VSYTIEEDQPITTPLPIVDTVGLLRRIVYVQRLESTKVPRILFGRSTLHSDKKGNDTKGRMGNILKIKNHTRAPLSKQLLNEFGSLSL